ncbi:unnamed protein product [Albugo candida]|uniref:Ubiquitin-like protease family profile domain-containing protein n=1 Tax=Albugo candida TaxID=65357 RepID=A0A024G2Z7_9STRA|nr:unnamed protein product [Albugo candida]|eukprot:CCI40892.1 unnamed protein product [Albugo candida]
MDVEALLDRWFYERRLEDSKRHCTQLLHVLPSTNRWNTQRDFVVSEPFLMNEAATFDTLDDRNYSSIGEQCVRNLRMIQELNEKEYGLVKRIKKVSPLEETRKKNRELELRMNMILDTHQISEKRKQNDRNVHKQLCEQNVSSFTSVARNERYRFTHEEEIKELEEKLAAQQISRSSRIENVYYEYYSKREAKILIEEVASELLRDTITDFHEEMRLALLKKELRADHSMAVADAMKIGSDKDVIICKFNVDLTRQHFRRLLPKQWLNDEIINFWFQLLQESNAALAHSGEPEKSCHFFNSFFYTKVSEDGYNYRNVRRWTRKVDLFGMDKIFVPVNLSNTHWCLAVIFMKDKKIQYYDSMRGCGLRCLETLRRYICDEMKDKKNTEIVVDDWELIPTTIDTPQQKNGFDCGVFTCIFAEYVASNHALDFVQRDMEYHRQRMAYNILQGSIVVGCDVIPQK